MRISNLRGDQYFTNVLIFSNSKNELIDGSANKSSESVRNYCKSFLSFYYSTKFVYSIFKRV